MREPTTSIRLTYPVTEVVEVSDEPSKAAFIPEKTAKAVTVKVGQRNPTSDGPEIIAINTGTRNAVYVDGKSTWVLGSDFARSFKRGMCFTTNKRL